jgi:hypothetical protein
VPAHNYEPAGPAGTDPREHIRVDIAQATIASAAAPRAGEPSDVTENRPNMSEADVPVHRNAALSSLMPAASVGASDDKGLGSRLVGELGFPHGSSAHLQPGLAQAAHYLIGSVPISG